MKIRDRYFTALGLSLALSLSVYASASEEPILEFDSVGLYQWPDVRKDRKVIKTEQMLRERIVHLAKELDMDASEGQAMELGWDLLTSKLSVRMNPTDDGMGASLIFEPGVGAPGSMFEHLGWLAEQSGFQMGVAEQDSVTMMGPFGEMEIAHDDNRLWIKTVDAELLSASIPSRGLPEGIEALVSGRVDFNGIAELFAPEILSEMEQNPEMLGSSPISMLIGPYGSPVEFAMGVGDKKMHVNTRLIDAKEGMRAMGGDPLSVFVADDFGAVPVDAVRVSAAQSNIGTLLKTIEQISAVSGENPLDEINRELGVDIVDEILGNIGDRVIFYMSESTGGGGLFSSIVLLELNDADSMRDSHERLVLRLNKLAEEHIRGYGHVMSWKAGGAEAWTMTAPGLPIPLEPSWAIVDDYLVIAVSPGSLRIAMRQLESKSRRSILDQRGFKESVLSRIPEQGAAAVNYSDTKRLVKKGYGMTSMLTSALANAARLPEEPSRIQGSLIDDYQSFTSGVQQSSMVTWWEGDDLVTHMVGDESMLVQISAGLGSVADVQGIAVPALAAGVLLPALGQARERSRELVASTQVRSIIQGMFIYAGNHNDQAPESLEVLVQQGLMEYGSNMSPFGPAYDGRGDIVIRTDSTFEEHMFNSRCIIAIDRAMLVNGHESVAVGFADAHVELVEVSDLYDMLEWPENNGAAEAFDIEDY